MPRLNALELLNFRSHARSTIHFDGRPLAITGANGAGKTNILEALSMFSPGRGLRRADRDMLARAPENIGWKLTLTGQTDTPWQIETSAKPSEPRQLRINDKSATQSAMGDYLRLVWMVPALDRIWIDSASDRRRFFDRIVLSFVPTHGETVLSYERAMRDRNRLLKDGVIDPHWYHAIEAQMEEATSKIIAARAEVMALLNTEMENAASAFPIGRLSLAYEAEPDIGLDWAELWAETRAQDRYAGTTRIGPHKVNFDAEFVAKSQRAALCSTGEQKALLIALFLANARALEARGQFVALLLDEVAAHLDENRRAALFDELCALNAQIVMTGTESDLFSALGTRGKFAAVSNIDGLSKVS